MLLLLLNTPMLISISNLAEIFLIVCFYVFLFCIYLIVSDIYSNRRRRNVKNNSLFLKIERTIKDKRVCFLDKKIVNATIKSLLVLINANNEPTYVVTLNDNYKTMHVVELENDLIIVKYFRITFVSNKIRTLSDLISYINKKSVFKLKNYCSF